MQRVIWLTVGGKRFHLLKLAGAFFVIGAILKVAESSYDIFVTLNKGVYAQVRPELIGQLFGWAMNAPYAFTNEDMLGVLLGPIATFMFWLGLAVVGLMVYQSGKVIFPIEEYDEKIKEHHRMLIQKAVEHSKKRKH